jgi:hypothetical protein
MYPLSTRGGNHPTTSSSLRRRIRIRRIHSRIRHGSGHRICRTRGRSDHSVRI